MDELKQAKRRSQEGGQSLENLGFLFYVAEINNHNMVTSNKKLK